LVGWQEGHPACKKSEGDGGGGYWLVWMEWRPAGWSVCLPLLISLCTIKSRSSLLTPAEQVVPEKGPQNGCGGGGDTIGVVSVRQSKVENESECSWYLPLDYTELSSVL